MIPIHNPAGGTRAAANLSRDVATGPCSTGRENNRSDGFVSPLFRKTQTGFVLLHSLCLKSLALVLRTGVVCIYLLLHLLTVPDLSGEPPLCERSHRDC